MGYREIALDYYGGGNPDLLLQLLGNTAGNNNGDWIDTSIYNSNATQYTTSAQPVLTTDLFGAGNSGYLFDGADDKMQVIDSDRFSFSDAISDLPFSIKFKIKFSVIKNAWLVSKRDGNSSNIEWQLLYYSGSIWFMMYSQNSGSNYISIVAPLSVVVDTIYEIKATYDGSGDQNGLNVYINGSLGSQTRTRTGTYVKMTNTTSKIAIGSANWSIAYPHSGAITDIEIWKGVI